MQGRQNILQHYLDELEALRQEGVEFANSHPEVARELGMNEEGWSDPQAEMLMQSFAYLTARVRNQIDIDKSAVPNALLNQLAPYMQAPVPCMAVLEPNIAASSAEGQLLERGRIFTSEARTAGRKIECRFRNCYRTPIWPLKISGVELMDISDISFDGLETSGEIRSLVKVGIETYPNKSLKELEIHEKGLRFYLNAKTRSLGPLYEMFSTSLERIFVKVPGKDRLRSLGAKNLVWRGFEEDESVLPDKAELHPGYRLIREYFAFPQKFLFFDVEKLELQGAETSFELYFAFSTPPQTDIELSRDSLKLNCFPAINLFEQPIEPIRLNHRRLEYALHADRINQAYSEVYEVNSLYALETGKAPRIISPCFELREFEATEKPGYHYSFRRELTDSEKIPGTRCFLSFHDHNLSLADIPAEAIGGTAICTNRRAPEKLNNENSTIDGKPLLLLEGAGPIVGARLASKVSSYVTPRLDEQAAWKLVSQLSLNFLSMNGSAQALDVFKNILESYADTSNPTVLKQIQSLTSIDIQRESRYVHHVGSSGMAQGLKISLKMNTRSFTSGSPVLFASICRHFFVLYANLGTYVELILETDKHGEWKRWPPLAGAMADL